MRYWESNNKLEGTTINPFLTMIPTTTSNCNTETQVGNWWSRKRHIVTSVPNSMARVPAKTKSKSERNGNCSKSEGSRCKTKEGIWWSCLSSTKRKAERRMWCSIWAERQPTVPSDNILLIISLITLIIKINQWPISRQCTKSSQS